MRTIKDVFKKVDEMKIDIDTTEMNNTNKVLAETQEHAYNQSLEDIKPIIEKGIKEILEGLKGEELEEFYDCPKCKGTWGEIYKDECCPKCGIMLEKSAEKMGFNQREQKLCEDIEKIIN